MSEQVEELRRRYNIRPVETFETAGQQAVGMIM